MVWSESTSAFHEKYLVTIEHKVTGWKIFYIKFLYQGSLRRSEKNDNRNVSSKSRHLNTGFLQKYFISFFLANLSSLCRIQKKNIFDVYLIVG